MKKKIAILGSTGSIGKTLIKIIKKDKNYFNLLLLSANKDYKNLFKQAKLFNVKNLIITDYKSYQLLKKKCKNTNINVYNNFDKSVGHYRRYNKKDFKNIASKTNLKIQKLIYYDSFGLLLIILGKLFNI